MNINNTEQQIVDEVISGVSNAEQTVKAIKFDLASDKIEDIPNTLDLVAAYDRAIQFYYQNTAGTTVNITSEADSRVNDLIKKGLNL